MQSRNSPFIVDMLVVKQIEKRTKRRIEWEDIYQLGEVDRDKKILVFPMTVNSFTEYFEVPILDFPTELLHRISINFGPADESDEKRHRSDLSDSDITLNNEGI
jgi:regulatory protein YycI of two-component signal transduction system YycFG